MTSYVWFFHISSNFLQHQLNVLEDNLILTLTAVSTTPQVKGSVPQENPPLLSTLASSRSLDYPEILSTFATNWMFSRPPPWIKS